MFKNFFACKHKTLTEIKEDGRQYCTVCNKAFVPDCPHIWELFGKNKQKCKKCGELRMIDEGPCRHVWEKDSQRNITNTLYGNTIAIVDVLRCEKCGEMKEFRLNN
jgi:hypothetical protein